MVDRNDLLLLLAAKKHELLLIQKFHGGLDAPLKAFLEQRMTSIQSDLNILKSP